MWQIDVVKIKEQADTQISYSEMWEEKKIGGGEFFTDKHYKIHRQSVNQMEMRQSVVG